MWDDPDIETIIATERAGGIQIKGILRLLNALHVIALVLTVLLAAIVFALVGLQSSAPRYEFAFHREHERNADLCIVLGFTDGIMDNKSGLLYTRTFLVRTSLTGYTQSVTYTNYSIIP